MPLLEALAAGGVLGALGATGNVLGGIGASRRARRQRRRVRRLVAFAARQAEAESKRFEQTAAFQGVSKFYRQIFEQGVPDFLQTDFANRIRAAQAARGTAFGGAGAKQEALSLSMANLRARQESAQPYLQTALMPFQVRQSAFQQYLGETGLGRGVAAFGPSPLEVAAKGLSGFVGGFAGGFQAGLGGFGLPKTGGQQQQFSPAASPELSAPISQQQAMGSAIATGGITGAGGMMDPRAQNSLFGIFS